MKYFIGPPPPSNPVVRVLAAVLAALALAVAVFFGAVVVMVLTGLVLLLGSAVWLRCWWLGRRLRSGRKPDSTPEQSGDTVIEAEYTVLSRRED